MGNFFYAPQQKQKPSTQAPYELYCGHSFDKEYIKQLKRENKTCPICLKPIQKKCFSGYELYTLTDNLQCQSCHWIPHKLVTFSPSSLKVEHLFNHHCVTCQFNCHYFKRAPSHKHSIQLIRENLKPRDESFSPDMGQCLRNAPSREYDKYDYLYCKKCHEAVLTFHDEDFESLEKHSPDDPIFEERVECYRCLECRRLTWGTLVEKTYQKLPRCGICNNIVKLDQWFRRFCCRSTPFHFDCSVKHSTCPKCETECKISLEISRLDPSMQEVLFNLQENDNKEDGFISE